LAALPGPVKLGVKLAFVAVCAYLLTGSGMLLTQRTWDADERARLNELNALMALDEVSLEGQQKALREQSGKLAAMQKQLDDYKAQKKIKEHNELVKPFNELLDKHKKDIAAYNEAIRPYNAKVAEAQKLVKEINDMFSIIPGLPRPA
jgi:peptidoglycan hydrolase CwlO-like protein